MEERNRNKRGKERKMEAKKRQEKRRKKKMTFNLLTEFSTVPIHVPLYPTLMETELLE